MIKEDYKFERVDDTTVAVKTADGKFVVNLHAMSDSTYEHFLKITEEPKPEDDDSSYYCELCTACGIDGCCSAINCIATVMEFRPKKCLYGKGYLVDIQYTEFMNKIHCEIFDRLEKKEIDADQAVKEWHESFKTGHDAFYARK